MQDILAQTKAAKSILDTLTLGDLLRMIDSAGAANKSPSEKTTEAKAILLNTIGCVTAGHTLPNCPQGLQILQAVTASMPEEVADALRVRMLLQLISINK